MKKELVGIERAVEERFFDLVHGKESGHLGLNTYRELVAYRYSEVLERCFVKSKILIGDDWDALVEKFMRSGASSPLVRSMPNEFRKFATKELEKIKALKDLMWFEWIEIESTLSKPTKKQNRKFEWKKRITTVPSFRAKKLRYSVFKGEIERGKYWILFFTDNRGDTYWMETTEFIYKLLQKSKKHKNIQNALKEVAKTYRIDYKKAKEIAYPILNDYFDRGLLH